TGAPQAMMGTRVRGSMNSDDALAMESEEAPSAPTPRPFEEVERPSLQGSTVPTALHRQARNQRAANDCRSAVASYERLFSGHPRYPQSGQARLEAGDCYRRMGRLADARRMFERASRSAQVAAAARRELARLDATENAPVVDIATEAQ
ncbi:MAG: tol-pal system YbgF family protein, partial [Sandaracinaceae bacterium]